MNRRNFLLNSLYSSALLGGSSLPFSINDAHAMTNVSLQHRMLVHLLLPGGPNMRALIVPAYESGTQTVGNKYWKNSWRAHNLINGDDATLQKRWNDDYFKITVGGSNWNANIDSGSLNNGQTFGIWKEASWLIDMFMSGKVAIFSNAVGFPGRSHQAGFKVMENGFTDTPSNDAQFSGWGGRLAQETNGRAVSLTNIPSPFCFGQQGDDRTKLVVNEFVSMHNSRLFGLFGDNTVKRTVVRQQKMAASLQAYYATLRTENLGTDLYDKFLDQEAQIRKFSGLINERLADYQEPALLRALWNAYGTDNQPHGLNVPVGDSSGVGSRLLRLGDFGQQIRNLNDAIRSNDILDLRAASMEINGWDTHVAERLPGNPNDVNDISLSRGIETKFKDMFGGPTSEFPNHLHGGFSALWDTLPQADKDKMVICMAGEFGRQIRANSSRGTDHGEGNHLIVISEKLNGGLYGTLFPESEIDLLDDSSVRSPAIKGETDIDHIFGAACDWVKGSPSGVFPNRDQARIEAGVNVDNLFNG